MITLDLPLCRIKIIINPFNDFTNDYLPYSSTQNPKVFPLPILMTKWDLFVLLIRFHSKRIRRICNAPKITYNFQFDFKCSVRTQIALSVLATAYNPEKIGELLEPSKINLFSVAYTRWDFNQSLDIDTVSTFFDKVEHQQSNRWK